MNEPNPETEADFQYWRALHKPEMWAKFDLSAARVGWNASHKFYGNGETTTFDPKFNRSHTLKTDPSPFAQVKSGIKKFELRKNDRNFKVGDFLLLKETVHSAAQMARGEPLKYTGEKLAVVITHILTSSDFTGIEQGYCILSIQLIK